MNYARMLRLSAVLLCAAAAALFAEGRPEVAPRTVAIFGLKGPTSISMLPLFEKAPDLGAGYTASIQAVGSPDLITSRILSGEADIAFVPVNLGAILYAKGVPIELAATTGDGLVYVVTSRDDIHGIKDLAGKTLYDSSKGAAPEYVMDYELQKSGIDPRTGLQHLFTYGHTELAQQLIAGRVDLAVLPEPFVSIALAKNPKLRVAIDLQKEWSAIQGTPGSYPITALLVKRQLANEAPGVVRRFLAAEKESIAWVIAHPQQTGALAQQYLDLPGPIIASAMPRLSLRYAAAADARPDVEAFFKVLYSYDPASIGGRMPDDGFYFTD